MATTMGKQCSVSWIVSSALATIGAALVCTHASAQNRSAVSLKGVVYLDSSGSSANAVGMIRLVVGNRPYELTYARAFLKTRFKSPVCRDIGAVWSVTVQNLAGMEGYLASASCDGQVDENVHGPQKVVREYFDLLGKRAFRESEDLLSPACRRTGAFKRVKAELSDLDPDSVRKFVLCGWCLEARAVDRALNRTMLRSIDCYLETKGEIATVSFEVVKNTTTNRWEIDAVEVDVLPKIPSKKNE